VGIGIQIIAVSGCATINCGSGLNIDLTPQHTIYDIILQIKCNYE
jgi:hypothetical protein